MKKVLIFKVLIFIAVILGTTIIPYALGFLVNTYLIDLVGSVDGDVGYEWAVFWVTGLVVYLFMAAIYALYQGILDELEYYH